MSEVVRSIKFDEKGDPCLCVQPRINPENYPPFAVPKDSAWMYSHDHNPKSFQLVMTKAVCWMFERWNMGLITRERWTAIASAIEDGIDDLLAAPPRDKIVDEAVRQQMQESMKDAAKNAEFDSRTNTLKMAVSL